jgi:hypothetical protein
MAKKPEHSIHPLRMIDALKTINTAAGLFSGAAHTAANLLDACAEDPDKVRHLARELNTAAIAFRHAMWGDAP